jgi:hypothetical protein
MDPVSTLVGFAEVSVAIAGFAAIVLVLGTRADSLEPHHAANIRVMVLNGVASALFCLFSVAVLAFEISSPLVWRLLSGFGLALLIGASIMNYALFLRHLPPAPRTATVWWSFAAVAGLIQLANAVGAIATPSFALFLLGLVVVLSQAGAQFVQMVYALLGRAAA